MRTEVLNKFSLYVFLVLVFLGVSKNFSPNDPGANYLQNKRVLGSTFQGPLLSLVLIDRYQKGFLIKTYYLKFKIIYGFKKPEYVTYRASNEFWKYVKPFLGMSIFRRESRNQEGNRTLEESTVPMPPGTLFIGKPAFGHWRFKDSGQKEWVFHRAYKAFPRKFGWGDFSPTYEFFSKSQIHLNSDTPFFGLNNEFGSDGPVSKNIIIQHSESELKQDFKWKSVFAKYAEIPPLRMKPEGNNNE